LWAGVQAIAVIALLQPTPVQADDGDVVRSPGIAIQREGGRPDNDRRRAAPAPGQEHHRDTAAHVRAGGHASLRQRKVRSSSGTTAPKRPSILPQRWLEDWSVLADPRVPRQPLDSLKYIPLSAYDSKTYLSFGGDIRERFEANNAVNFGVHPSSNQSYLLSRSDAFADLRIADQVQVFTQFESDFAPWKTILTPADQNVLDLEQAFVTVTEPVGDGTARVRLGRQQMNFDLQRFVSNREGPNVPQSYDAAWGDYQIGPWEFITFYSQPVQVRDLGAQPFENYSSDALTFSMARVQRDLFGWATLSGYYAYFTLDNAKYLTVSGTEHRDIIDVRFYAKTNNFDGDIEIMSQTGSIGNDTIMAWAVGSVVGYTLSGIDWKPRLGVQFDAASGNSNPRGNVLQTFNPLFPNGLYFTLAGYTTYVNLIHFKQSMTLQPTSSVKIFLAVAEQWRQTTADAVYTIPNIPVPGTAGQPGLYTGTYGQVQVDWTLTPQLSFLVQAVYFDVSDVIVRAGGHNSTYLGVQLAYGW
jgi:Alginate export